MTENQIYLRSYSEMSLNAHEVLRYSGVRRGGEELIPKVEKCFEEARTMLTYRAVLCEAVISLSDESVSFPFGSVGSRDLRRALDGCDRAVIFAATVGIGMDRLVSKYSRLSPSKALIMQGLGAERIEALCDDVSSELEAEYGCLGLCTLPRFSPGYGDFALSHQKDIIGFLDTPRRLGLTLNESLLMSPTKSVTAVVGIK